MADLAGARRSVVTSAGRPVASHAGATELSTPGLPAGPPAKWWSWERALMVVAVATATVAFWITLQARFLQYPGWLAVQKADLILGPIAVGLYWHRRRPHNRLGLMLIGLGLLGVVYILQSSTVPALFGSGLVCELLIFTSIVVVILAFPNGRLDGPSKLIVVFLLIGSVSFGLVLNLSVSSLAPFLPLSGCRSICPQNGLAVWGPPSWTGQNEDVQIITSIVASLAAISLLVWRFVSGTPPRRRALAIGSPVAILFLLSQAGYNTNYLFTPGAESTSQQPIGGPLDWIYAASPSLFWYGFLFALIAAQLFAGRVLRDVVRRSHGRPSFGELQGMLRGPLGDPGLRVGFWDSGSERWTAADGETLEPPAAGQTLTEIERNDEPAVVLVHDSQLSEDPELLQAAGAVLALAAENAELDASQKESLRERSRLVEELRSSRARIVETAERERERLERDLHDGAQQRLMAIQIKLKMAERHAPDGQLAEELEQIQTDAVDAVAELRALAHGIYPAVLRARGLADALRSAAMSAPIAVEVEDAGIGRAPEAIESAIYFCTCEAIQNAVKHAGSGARVKATLARRDGAVEFAVVDDGVGMALGAPGGGFGLVGMVDRIEAVGGRIEIVSAPGRGTSVQGRIPDRHDGMGGGRFARAPRSQAPASTRGHVRDG